MPDDRRTILGSDNEPHYVVHVRVEKVLMVKVGGIKVVDSGDKRVVEDVVNVTKKSTSLRSGINFIKGTLDLTLDEEDVNKKATDA